MKTCEICDDKGWIFSWSEGRENMSDGYHIEKCDTCEENGTASFETDMEAIKLFAAINGWTTAATIQMDSKGWKI